MQRPGEAARETTRAPPHRIPALPPTPPSRQDPPQRAPLRPDSSGFPDAVAAQPPSRPVPRPPHLVPGHPAAALAPLPPPFSPRTPQRIFTLRLGAARVARLWRTLRRRHDGGLASRAARRAAEAAARLAPLGPDRSCAPPDAPCALTGLGRTLGAVPDAAPGTVAPSTFAPERPAGLVSPLGSPRRLARRPRPRLAMRERPETMRGPRRSDRPRAARAARPAARADGEHDRRDGRTWRCEPRSH